MELNQIQIAALLHDVGKFYQRTGKRHSTIYDKYSKDDFGWNGAHAKWSADFVRDIYGEEVENLVLYHHEPKNSDYPDLAKIIQKADHHASSERIKSEKNLKVNEEPLISIFSRVKLDDIESKKSEDEKELKEYYIPLEPLSLDKNTFEKIKPQPGKKINMNYVSLWADFKNELKRIGTPNFNTTLAILKKYTSTIPSAVYKSEADISLYDHLKTTAALTTSRFRYNQETKKLKQTNHQKVYLAVTGDISGIQKFIYKVSSPQDAQSGMSKRLRGRSLYLNLLNDSIASRLVENLGFDQSNILFCGGGRFIIIVANTEKIKSKIEEFKDKINNYFIKEFNAELYLGLAYEECSGKDLESFGKVTADLNMKLAEDKKHKFIDQLDKVFEVEKNVKYDKTCSVCGKTTNKEICEACKSHENLGRIAINSKFIIKCFSRTNNEYDFYEERLGIGYLFKNYPKTIDFIKNLNDNHGKYEKIEIIRLNSTNFLTEDVISGIKHLEKEIFKKITLSFNFMGNTVPKFIGKSIGENKIATSLYFEHLAKISKGANKLGIVKMDVDNLGKVFTKGFKHLEEEKTIKVDDEEKIVIIKGGTISRISTLSSQLDMFFSGFINEIAKQYRIFSELCPSCEEKLKDKKIERIKLNIQKYDSDVKPLDISESDADNFFIYHEKEDKVCSNCEKFAIPTIHINYSGGDDLLVLGPYDDIIKFSREFREKFRQWTCENPSITLSAGINIVDSKFPIGKAVVTADEYLEASKNCGEDKDKITLFNDVVKWENSKDTSKGYYELLDFGMELEKYVENEDISRGMNYTLLRLWQDTFFDYSEIPSNSVEWKNNSRIRMQKKKYVPKLKYKLRLIKDANIKNDLDKKGVKFMPWIRIPVSWTSLRTR
ncbi:MAG: type III-A CRISPR-associated protein Cas10/Csm1 [Methanobacteriaceae archaeon]|jgi:CRISPR-associated protein Csm1|nr:type III-A CRISPR-associated protein Cas10/Csm1 [Candidatus Methanorudis spinitermitis]